MEKFVQEHGNQLNVAKANQEAASLSTKVTSMSATVNQAFGGSRAMRHHAKNEPKKQSFK